MINKVFVTNVCPSGKFFDCYPLASFEDKRHLSAGQSKRVTNNSVLYAGLLQSYANTLPISTAYLGDWIVRISLVTMTYILIRLN